MKTEPVPSVGWVVIGTFCDNCRGKKTVGESIQCPSCNGNGEKPVRVNINDLYAEFKQRIADEIRLNTL